MASMQLREMPENCSAAKGVRGGEGCRAKGPRVTSVAGKEVKNGEGTRGMSSLKGKNGVKAVLMPKDKGYVSAYRRRAGHRLRR